MTVEQWETTYDNNQFETTYDNNQWYTGKIYVFGTGNPVSEYITKERIYTFVTKER